MCRLTAVALALRQPAAGPATQGRRRSASRCTGEFTVPAISGRMNTSAEAVCRRRGQLVRGGAGTWCSSQDTSVLTARSSCWKSRRDHGFTGVSRHEVAALVAVDCQPARLVFGLRQEFRSDVIRPVPAAMVHSRVPCTSPPLGNRSVRTVTSCTEINDTPADSGWRTGCEGQCHLHGACASYPLTRKPRRGATSRALLRVPCQSTPADDLPGGPSPHAAARRFRSTISMAP